MGSGKKSNGIRPVNKVDGRKKRAKKAMHKSRRADAKKIVKEESVPNSCNDFLDEEPWRTW